jgi:hypothetical protein
VALWRLYSLFCFLSSVVLSFVFPKEAPPTLNDFTITMTDEILWMVQIALIASLIVFKKKKEEICHNSSMLSKIERLTMNTSNLRVK